MTFKRSNQKINTDYDIMIVGGGPAGISTWLHLHKYAPELAEKTILIEKEKYPREKLCGGGVGAWSGYVLKHLGITLDIPYLLVSDLEFRYGDDFFTLHQTNCFTMVQRALFDHALAKIAMNRGLQIFENEHFKNFHYKNNLIYINTNKREYAAKILVGADGSLSSVRRGMNLPNISHLSPTLEIFSPVNPDYDPEFDTKKIVVDMTAQTKNLQGYVWHVPCIRDGVPTIGHGLADFRVYPKKPKANMRSIFAHELKIRHININQKLWHSHPIRWPSNEDIVSNSNIILVGDAVGIEPAFGGGIHFALSYGDVAAKAIIDAYNFHDFSFKNYNEKIQSHLVGKFITKCTHIANELYSGRMKPFDAAREVFTIKER